MDAHDSEVSFTYISLPSVLDIRMRSSAFVPAISTVQCKLKFLRCLRAFLTAHDSSAVRCPGDSSLSMAYQMSILPVSDI